MMNAKTDAGSAPLERVVRPRALLLAHTDGRETLHPIAEYAVAYRDTAVSEALLYDQASLDAAVVAERERCAKDFEEEVESWDEMRKAGFLGAIKRKGAAAIRGA